MYVGPCSAAETGIDLAPFVGQSISEAFPAAFDRGSYYHIFAVATGSEPEHHRVYRYGDETIAESWFRIDVRPLGRCCALMSYTIVPQQPAASRPAQPPASADREEIRKALSATTGDAEQWLYRRTVEQMPLAVVVWRAETDNPRDLRLVFAGPRSTAETGTNMALFVGLPFSESFPAVYDTDLPYRVFAVATGSRPDHFEAYPYGDENVPDGWFQVEVQPLDQRCALVAYTNITEQHQAAEALLRRRREAAFLAEIGRVISSPLDIQKVYQSLATSVHQLIPYHSLAIGTVDLEQYTMTNVYCNATQVLTSEWVIGKPHTLRGVVTENVVRTRQAQLIQAETDAALLAQFPEARAGLDQELRSTIVVPLISRDEVVGVLTMRSREAQAYTQHHLDLAKQVGTQIAGAIANAWDYVCGAQGGGGGAGALECGAGAVRVRGLARLARAAAGGRQLRPAPRAALRRPARRAC